MKRQLQTSQPYPKFNILMCSLPNTSAAFTPGSAKINFHVGQGGQTAKKITNLIFYFVNKFNILFTFSASGHLG